MNVNEIVKWLRQTLPKNTEAFSDKLDIEEMSCTNKLVTCTTTSPHGLSTGDQIYIKGALTPNKITAITYSNGVATATTERPHDFTDGWQQYVVITGAIEPEFNSNHKFIHQPNRLTLEFEYTTEGTGDMLVLEDRAFTYNGYHTIVKIDDTTFTFTIDIDLGVDNIAYGDYVVIGKHRISGAISIDRAIESYTAQKQDNFWLFVVADRATAAKSRTTVTDGTLTTGGGAEVRNKIIYGFDIYVIFPCRDQISALQARNTADLFLFTLCKSLTNARFTIIGSDCQTMNCTLNGHDIYAYDRAYYVHVYHFETYFYINSADGYFDEHVAFRDILLNYQNVYNTNILTTDIDLDDEILP